MLPRAPAPFRAANIISMPRYSFGASPILLGMANSPRYNVADLAHPTATHNYRIPALINHRGRVLAFFDERPHPRAGSGWLGAGGAMADDLPNPNRILFCELELAAPGQAEAEPVTASFPPAADANLSAQANKNVRTYNGRWTLAQPVPGAPAVCSDACVASDGHNLTLAYGSSTEIGYFGSQYAGPRLEPYIAYGPSVTQLQHMPATELYTELRCDGLFATSGSTVCMGTTALLPYVVRTGTEAHIRIVHVQEGKIRAISDPITADNSAGIYLDETTLAWDGEYVHANFRAQGRGGRWVAYSRDGLSWSQPRPLDLSDPGCNAKILLAPAPNSGSCAPLLLIHPHTTGFPETGSAHPEPAASTAGDPQPSGSLLPSAAPPEPAGLAVASPEPAGPAVAPPETNSELLGARENGALVDYEGRVHYRFAPGEFGYADAVYLPGTTDLLVAYERAQSIRCEVVPSLEGLINGI